MKKYLLTALLGVFAFIGFTNADSVVYTDGVPSPSSIYYVGDINCDYGLGNEDYVPCYIPINEVVAPLKYRIENVFLDGVGDSITYVAYGGNCTNSCSSLNLRIKEIYFNDLINGNFDYLLLEFGNVSNQNGTFSISSDNLKSSLSSEGGDSGDSSSGLIEGGTAVFSGIISSLGSVVSEFIPYVAFLGLGLLGSIIGFVAIKRLINRIRAKVLGTFNSRRRK